MNFYYQYDPSQDSITELLKIASRNSIKFSPMGKITVERAGWNRGEISSVVTTYKTFLEALRAHKHTVQSLLKRARFNRLQLEELKGFHQWLFAATHLDRTEKQRQAVDWLLRLSSTFSGVRCRNLVELRAHLRSPKLIAKSLHELLEDRRWGAACCKIIFRLNPLLSQEHHRLLEQIPGVMFKEQVIGKIWRHDRWCCERIRDLVIDFGRKFDEVEESAIGFDELMKNLEQVIATIQFPFDYRMKNAKQNLESLRKALKARPPDYRGARAELKKAQLNLRNYRSWLYLPDSYEGMTLEKRQYFARVV